MTEEVVAAELLVQEQHEYDGDNDRCDHIGQRLTVNNRIDDLRDEHHDHNDLKGRVWR